MLVALLPNQKVITEDEMRQELEQEGVNFPDNDMLGQDPIESYDKTESKIIPIKVMHLLMPNENMDSTAWDSFRFLILSIIRRLKKKGRPTTNQKLIPYISRLTQSFILYSQVGHINRLISNNRQEKLAVRSLSNRAFADHFVGGAVPLDSSQVKEWDMFCEGLSLTIKDVSPVETQKIGS